jgi:hypothetical protein
VFSTRLPNSPTSYSARIALNFSSTFDDLSKHDEYPGKHLLQFYLLHTPPSLIWPTWLAHMPFSFHVVSLKHTVGAPCFWTDSWVLHTAWSPIFIEAGSFIARACRFFLCFLAFYFLSLIPHVSFVPDTFLGSDTHVTVLPLSSFSSSSPFMGSHFYVLGAHSILLTFSCAFFTRYSAAG